MSNMIANVIATTNGGSKLLGVGWGVAWNRMASTIRQREPSRDYGVKKRPSCSSMGAGVSVEDKSAPVANEGCDGMGLTAACEPPSVRRQWL